MAGEGLDVGTLTGRIELEDKLSNVLQQIGGSIGKFEDSFKDAGQSVLNNAASFFTAEAALRAVEGAIHLGIETIKELTIEGAAVADVEENFNHLTESAGRLGSTLITELRAGTHDTITDFELMKLANADLAAGLNLSDQQFRTMADGAFALAQATGVDVKQALESMNEALLKGQARGVQSLTGRIDMVKAEEEYAAKLKTTADRLTAEEKLQADREAILNAVATATGRLGEQSDGLDEKIAQAQTSWANFQEELGKTIATSPVLLTAFDAIRDELIAAFGGESASLVESIARGIENVAISAIDFAKVLVDGVGIAGIQWNAFKVVVETSAQGFRAITFVVEEILLALMKVANFASGGSLFGDAIAATEQDINRLYDAMAQGEAKIAGYKAAEDEWAVSSGHAREALERVQQKMIDARDAQEGHTKATKEGAEAAEAGAVQQNKLAVEVESVGTFARMTKEEIQKYNQAWADLNSLGTTWRETLATLSPAQQKIIKDYLDMGASVEQLAVAFPNLTKAQIDSVRASEENTAKQVQGIEKLTAAWMEYYGSLADLTATDTEKAEAAALKKYEGLVKMLQDAGVTDAKYYDDAWKLYELDVQKNQSALTLKDSNSKAYLAQRLRDEEDTLKRMERASDNYTAAQVSGQRQVVRELQGQLTHWGAVGEAAQQMGSQGARAFSTLSEAQRAFQSGLDETKIKVRTLSGELISLAEAQARSQQGGSYNINAANFGNQFAQGGPGFGVSEAAARVLAQKGYSFQGILEMLRGGNMSMAQLQNLPQGPGPRIPGFREGAVGDFGDGTLAILHGKEAIVPLDKASGMGGGVTNNFYVNGTATDVARKISAEIMRTLKSQRQFPSA